MNLLTQSLSSGKIRQYSLIGCVGVTVIFSVLTYLGVPSHTYYYEGVPTSDIYGKQGEQDFLNLTTDGS